MTFIKRIKSKISHLSKYLWDNVGFYRLTFYTSMLTGILVAGILAVITHGRNVENMLQCQRFDTFMDYFNSINYGFRPYEKEVIYPPLMNVIYAVFGLLIPEDVMATGYPLNFRSDQMGLISFCIYMFVSLCPLIIFTKKCYQGSRKENTLFCFVMMFSLPFLFAIERANSIILCLAFLMIYFYGYNSEKTWVKHIALVSLAIAVSLKIYVVVFGLLLVREKKWKDALICCGYGIFFFFAPFLLLEGENKNPLMLVNNILNTTKSFSEERFGYKYNFSNNLTLISKISGYDLSGLFIPFAAFSFVVLIVFVLNKNIEKWKFVTYLSLISICIPGFSYTYTLIYLLFPLILFLKHVKENEKITALNTIYLVLFIIIFIPISFEDNGTLEMFTTIDQFQHTWDMEWVTIIENLALYIMFFLLSAESVGTFMKQLSIKKRLIVYIPFVVIFVLIVMQIVNVQKNPENTYLSVKEKETSCVMTNDLYDTVSDFLDERTFCFPSVPMIKNSKEINAYDSWYDVTTREELLEDPEIILDSPPEIVCLRLKGKYDDEKYDQLQKTIYEMGYICDYKNMGIFSAENSDSYEIWVLNSGEKFHLFENNSGTEEDPFVINSKEELITFSDKVDKGWNFVNKYVSLDNDIDMQGVEWNPIGSCEKRIGFSGLFNGKGYSIKNLTISGYRNLKYAALFEYMNGMLYNLELKGGTLSGNKCASFVNYSDPNCGTIANCISSVNINGQESGALAGNFGGYIMYCVFEGSLNTDYKCYFSDPQSTISVTESYIAKGSFSENYTDISRNCIVADSGYIHSEKFIEYMNKNICESPSKDLKLCTYTTDEGDHSLSQTNMWQKYIEFDSLSVLSDRQNDDNEKEIFGIELYPNDIQYGPYFRMEKGAYVVKYFGENIQSADVDVYSLSQEFLPAVEVLKRTDDYIEYSFELDEEFTDIEFRMFNNTDSKMYINKLVVEGVY